MIGFLYNNTISIMLFNLPSTQNSHVGDYMCPRVATLGIMYNVPNYAPRNYEIYSWSW
jgi:hypothetical protein